MYVTFAPQTNPDTTQNPRASFHRHISDERFYHHLMLSDRFIRSSSRFPVKMFPSVTDLLLLLLLMKFSFFLFLLPLTVCLWGACRPGQSVTYLLHVWDYKERHTQRLLTAAGVEDVSQVSFTLLYLTQLVEGRKRRT